MIVMKLDVEAKYGKIQHENVRQCFISAYRSRSERAHNYEQYVKNRWTSLIGDRLKALYEIDELISVDEVKNIQYFVIDRGLTGDINQKTFEVLVLFKNAQVNASIQTVINDIKKKVNNLRIQIKIVRTNYVYFYPYNQLENDIWDPVFVVKAKIDSSVKYNKREMIINLVVGFFTICLCIANIDFMPNGVKESLIASGIFYIGTVFLSKIHLGLEIILEDLPNLFEANNNFSSNQINAVVSDDIQLNDPIGDGR